MELNIKEKESANRNLNLERISQRTGISIDELKRRRNMFLGNPVSHWKQANDYPLQASQA